MEPNIQSQSSAPVTPPAPVNPSPVGNLSAENPVILHDGPPKKVGPIIAVLIIVIVLVIAAVYLFASRVNKQAPTNTTADSGGNSQTVSEDTAAAQQSVQPVTGTSNDTADLEADLNASTNGLDNQNF